MVSNFAVGQDLRLVATSDTMTGNGHSDPHVSCCKKCTGDQPTDYLVNGFSASPGETPSNGALSSPTYDRDSASDKNERGCKDKEVESPQSQPPSQTTVLIIGGGPTGLLASILLAKRGLHSTILEQHARRLGQPKAHAINPRSLEILRQAGLDTNTLRKLGAAPSDADAVRFVLSITGLEIGQLPYERQDEQVKQLTPEPLFNIPQPLLEEHLRKTALDTGMVTMWRGWRWQDGVESRDKTILSKVLDRRTQNEIYITSRYLLGCDGAHALSRACFGIPFDTVDGLPSCPIHYCSVNFDADMSSEKSGMLWFIMTKTAGKRNFIAYNRKNNWVFVTRYDPNTTPATTFTEDYCRSLIDQSIGKKIDYRILGITLWSTTPQVAKFYRSRKIRNGFIAGDAAHCFPSTGGLGINTGIGDVHNLVWKIQAVENEWAPESLLDTYETERIPIAIANSTQSSRNETKIHRLGHAVFGEDDKSVEQRMAEATARQEIQDAIMDNYEHFDSLDLQLGYVYGRPRDWSKSVSGFVPTSVPGARLPHAWVMFEGREISTLDTAKGNGFTLYTSPDFVATQKLETDRVPIDVVQIGRTITDEDGEWTRLMGLQEGPAGVLVRPDQHILAKVRSIEEIVSILRAFLATS